MSEIVVSSDNEEGFVPIKDLPDPSLDEALQEEPVAFVSHRLSMGVHLTSIANDGTDTLVWTKERDDDISLYRESVVRKLREEVNALRESSVIASDILNKPMTLSQFLTTVQKAFIMLSGTAQQKLQAEFFFKELFKRHPQHYEGMMDNEN